MLHRTTIYHFLSGLCQKLILTPFQSLKHPTCILSIDYLYTFRWILEASHNQKNTKRQQILGHIYLGKCL